MLLPSILKKIPITLLANSQIFEIPTHKEEIYSTKCIIIYGSVQLF